MGDWKSGAMEARMLVVHCTLTMATLGGREGEEDEEKGRRDS